MNSEIGQGQWKYPEIRSPEVQEIMGKVPSWITRNGIGLMIILLLALIVGSWFFRYPDIIRSSVVITTQNPPADLVARAEGRLTGIRVTNGQSVRNGDLLAIIQNPAQYGDILRLDSLLTLYNSDSLASMAEVRDVASLQTGEIQPFASAFFNSIQLLHNYTGTIQPYNRMKTGGLEQRTGEYGDLMSQLREQTGYLEKELKLSAIDLQRDSVLYSRGAISVSEYEKTRSAYLKKQADYTSIRSRLYDLRIEQGSIRQEMLEIESGSAGELNRLRQDVVSAGMQLQSAIAGWKEKYLLVSPVDGVVNFSQFWSSTQFIKQGDRVFSVIPSSAGMLLGKLQLPFRGAGKVRKGQTVNIRLYDYPYMEFGILKGRVENFSLVQEKDHYIVDVAFPGGLVTTNGMKIEFTHSLSGDAEIITEDIRLLNRIVSPLRTLARKFKSSTL